MDIPFDNPEKMYVQERLVCRLEIGDMIFSFTTYIRDLQSGGIMIDPPELAGLRLEPGEDVLVRYFRADAAYQFMSRVLESVGDSEESVEGKERQGVAEGGGQGRVLLSFPARITRLQRRKFLRAEAEGFVFFRTDLGGSRPREGTLTSISAGGIRFNTPRTGLFSSPIDPVGRNLSLQVRLISGEQITAAATVRRVIQDPDDPVSVHVLAEFLEMPVKQRNQLDELVLKLSSTQEKNR